MTFSRLVLRALSYLVPAHERADWVREWEAEIAYAWHASRFRGPTNELLEPAGRHPKPTSSLVAHLTIALRCAGAFEDALWLRIRRGDRTMVLQDIRYAVRTLRKNPLFTVVVLLTLALGIGANTAIFTLVDAVLLRPLPVENPEELTDVWTTCRRGFPYCSSSYPDFLDYRERNLTFTDMAAFAGADLTLRDGDGSRRIGAMLTTGNYFNLLGVHALRGRVLVPEDNVLGNAQAVAVLSHRMWVSTFGADPNVLGQTLSLDGASYTIVGVAPKAFRGTRLSANPDLWIPLASLSSLAERGGLTGRGQRWIGGIIARRRSGVTVEQARQDMLAISRQLEEEYGRGGRSITTEATGSMTLPAAQTGDDIVRFVSLLMVVVGAALLIACANVANLFLARASARRREIGVRIALGAGRSRLIHQLLTESLLLSFAGAALGLFAAKLVLGLLSTYALPGFVSIASLELYLDGRVLVFTTAVALTTGILFGLVPALQTTNPNLTNALRESSADPRSGTLLRTRGVLLSLQTALALVLLIGAGLFIRSLQNGLEADVGFQTRQLAMVSFNLSQQRYTEAETERFLADLTERSRRLPGAVHVSSAVLAPLSRGGFGFFINVPEYTPIEGEELRIEANWVGADYFRTMGIPVTGRGITSQDRTGSPLVAVINETMTRRWWPERDPVGRTFRRNADGSGPEVLIVGVARNVKSGLTQDPEPFIYYPIAQNLSRAKQVTLLVATDAPPTNVLPMLRQELRELDPDLAIAELTTLENRFAEYLMPQRMGTTLLSGLGGLTMLLAIVGIMGIVGYAVNQRRKEIGIRLALGAAKLHVLRVIVRSAVIPVAVGLGIGLFVAFGVTRLVANFMFGVAPTDPVTFVVAPALMAVVTIVAAYLPARRATNINPAEVLRSE